MHTFKHFQLGKAAPSQDERTLQLANYLTPSLPAAPSKYSVSGKVTDWPMYANDRLGDCTCAAAGHMVQAWTSFHQPWTPTEAEVVALYNATGYEDNGRVETDVLNYWRKDGFGHRRDRIAAYTAVTPRNHTQVKQAVWLFGGLYIGLDLPLTAQNQTTEWKLVYDAGEDALPGSWGGHAVCVTAYSRSGLEVITWGQRMKMTWGFWNRYCEEAYAVLSGDWTSTTTAPNGFNLAQLEADLHAIR